MWYTAVNGSQLTTLVSCTVSYLLWSMALLAVFFSLPSTLVFFLYVYFSGLFFAVASHRRIGCG